MTKWTAEQQAAISARNHAILVSAAAGSGKTAVLVERIVTLLREGADMERMMIVTFTRAAAAEMRQRLNQRLTQEAQSSPDVMGRALDELESADISTIHHFCQKILRSEFQAVDIDPMARVCEEQQRKLLFDQAFRDAMNELLADEQHEDFHALADAFSQDALHGMTDTLYGFLMSLPDPFDWLKFHVEHVDDLPLDEHPWYRVLVEHSARQLQGMDVMLSQQEAMFDEPSAVDKLRETWQKDRQAYDSLMAMDIGDPKIMAETLATFSFVRAAACKGLTEEETQWKKRFTGLRDNMKALIKELAAGLRLDEEKTGRELSVVKSMLNGLSDLTLAVHRHFMDAKRQVNVLDFSDLEQLTLNVLSKPELREKLQKQYDHLFVDECQDVSAIQDAIIQRLHGENAILFMVGDVKQSIYRFRLADPTLFLTRMRTWSDDPDARERRIFLQKNFRSRPPILDATNRVFRKLMKEDVTELDYLKEDELIAGRESSEDPPVEIHLIDPTDPSGEGTKMSDVEAQAAVCAKRMEALMQERFRDGDTERTYTWRDMVILMPKVSRVGGALAEELKKYGVPVYFDGADSYFTLPEILSVTSMLQVIDHPLQDIPLLSTLKLPPFQMTEKELADIRLCKTGKNVPFHRALQACAEKDSPLGKKCADALHTIEEWRFLSRVMRLSDFLWLLMRETGFYAECGALPEGSMRQANLRLMCQRASEYEDNGGTTLSGFLAQNEQMRVAGDSRSAKVLGEGENLVRIMTIHKSKGLEFPAVFCVGLSTPLHMSSSGKIRCHSRLGVCMPYINRKLNISRATMGDAAFEIRHKLDEKAERLRLLYVAMTRARERLMLLCVTQEKSLDKWRMKDSAYRVWSAESMTDWLMQAVTDEFPTQVSQAFSTGSPQAANPWNIRVWRYPHQQAVEKQQEIHSVLNWLEHVVSAPAGEKLGETWQTLEERASQAPLKTSVSALVRQHVLADPMPLSDADESEEDKSRGEVIVSPLRLSELPARPAFMEQNKASGAERGTLTHHALSLFDLERLRQADDLPSELRRQLDELEEKGCFTKEEAAMIPPEALCAFYESDVGRRMLESQTVRREWSFNLLLPEKDNTLLQGVIDCAFLEEDVWVLVDYKTDRIEDEEAFTLRYREQLLWYARALAEITGKRVKQELLYSLSNGKSYEVHESASFT